MEGCVFCRIIDGDLPASTVYSDDKVLAFLDTTPVNSGHVLVIPRVHAANLSELDEDVGGHIFKIAMRIDGALKKSGLKCEGVTLYLADGKAAFQDVFHVHLHVVPRFRGDGFGLKFGPNYGRNPEREELDRIAEKIREAMI